MCFQLYLMLKKCSLRTDLSPCLSFLSLNPQQKPSTPPADFLSMPEFINVRKPSEHDVFLQNGLWDKKSDWQLQKLHLRFSPAGKGDTNCLQIIHKSLMRRRRKFKRLRSFFNKHIHVPPFARTQKTLKRKYPCKNTTFVSYPCWIVNV